MDFHLHTMSHWKKYSVYWDTHHNTVCVSGIKNIESGVPRRRRRSLIELHVELFAPSWHRDKWGWGTPWINQLFLCDSWSLQDVTPRTTNLHVIFVSSLVHSYSSQWKNTSWKKYTWNNHFTKPVLWQQQQKTKKGKQVNHISGITSSPCLLALMR